MSELTDRIAEVLRQEAVEVVFGESNEEMWLRLARAVEAELQRASSPLCPGCGQLLDEGHAGSCYGAGEAP